MKSTDQAKSTNGVDSRSSSSSSSNLPITPLRCSSTAASEAMAPVVKADTELILILFVTAAHLLYDDCALELWGRGRLRAPIVASSNPS